MNKVTIGICGQENCKVDFAASLVQAVSKSDFVKRVLFIKGAYIHDNRQKIVQLAAQEDATHLMFIDTDMVFPEDGIKTLLERGKDIVGGCYNKRVFPPQTCVMVSFDGGPARLLKPDEVPDEPFEASVVPTGFMLINMDVFRKVPPPHFSFDTLDGKLVGEDVYFCRKVQKYGVEVWCDPTIRIKHIGDHQF